ncbi:MAG: ATP-binding protein [Pirellulaceae bacterium]
MLIEFRVENHRSIGEEQVISFEAANLGGAGEDPRPRQVEGHDKPLLTAAALYGANASGKTNFLSALAFMSEAVSLSQRMWEPDGGVPRTPFAWGPKQHEPSLFEATFLLEGVKYQYGFVVNDQEVEEEYLYAWPNGRKQTWWERERKKLKFGPQSRSEKALADLILDSTGVNSLYLSCAAQLRLSTAMPIYSWFSKEINLLNLGTELPSRISRRKKLAELFRDPTKQKLLFNVDDSRSRNNRIADNFTRLLSATDTGICGIRVKPKGATNARLSDRLFPFELSFQHQHADENAWIPFEQESHGTQTFIDIAMPILEALELGGIVVIDELERGLHSLLAAEIVSMFNNPETNPHNAQLLFTTHDTYLLGTVLGDPVLRRDQVWLTEKTPEGASVIYPLTDYKPRKGENLERGYLQGRYGAIPFLGELPYALESS